MCEQMVVPKQVKGGKSTHDAGAVSIPLEILRCALVVTRVSFHCYRSHGYHYTLMCDFNKQ